MIELLESEIAQDIMYGNSPNDMVNRAFSNKELSKIFELYRIRIRGFEFVNRQFEDYLKQPATFYTLGIYTAFVTLLYLLDNIRTKSVIQNINEELNENNFIHQINIQFLKK